MCNSFDLDVPYDRQVRNLEQPDRFYLPVFDCGYGELPARSPAFDVSLLTPCVGFIAVASVHPVAEQLINALIYLVERLF